MEFISVGEGWVGDPNLPPLVPYIPSSCPFILGFLPLALVYRLQNTKDCRVILSPSRFFLSCFPYRSCPYSPDIPSPCPPTFPGKVMLPGNHLQIIKCFYILFERASDHGAVWAASSYVRKTGVISKLSNYFSIIYINGIIDRYIYLWLAPQSCSSLCFPRRLLQNSEHNADQYLDWLEDVLLGSLKSCDRSYRLLLVHSMRPQYWTNI